jgi:chromosome segregation ATPase
MPASDQIARLDQRIDNGNNKTRADLIGQIAKTKEELTQTINASESRILGLVNEAHNELLARFDKVDEKFNGTDERLDGLDIKIDTLTADVTILKQSLRDTDNAIASLKLSTEVGFIRANERFALVNDRFDKMDVRFDNMDEKFNQVIVAIKGHGSEVL